MSIPAFTVVGRHNSGKTTLVTNLIRILVGRGYDVGSIKHHGHRGFDIDVPGKDSWRHVEAGSCEVAIASPDKFALVRQLDSEMEVTQILQMMAPHDIVIVEGYRHSGLPSLEIMRSGNVRDAEAARELIDCVGQGRRFDFDPTSLGDNADRMPDDLTFALATDIPGARAAAEALGIMTFGLMDYEGMVDAIIQKFGL